LFFSLWNNYKVGGESSEPQRLPRHIGSVLGFALLTTNLQAIIAWESVPMMGCGNMQTPDGVLLNGYAYLVKTRNLPIPFITGPTRNDESLVLPCRVESIKQ
jgi:hypothetical protein